MTLSDDLEKLDIAMSMTKNIEILIQTMDGLEKGTFEDQDQDRVLEILVQKILESEKYFRRPVDSKEVYEKLTSILEGRGKDEEAEQFQTRLAKMDSDLYEFKGRLQNFFGNNTKAMEYYRQALDFMPENNDAQKGFKRAEGRVLKAEKELKKLVANAQRGAMAKDLIKLGQALADLGRMDDALATYSQAMELDPKDDEAIARKGTALESMKRFDEAVELFQRALEFNPKSMIAKRGINYADYYFTHPDSDYYKD